eukprot:TRINITY_DN28079_c0_g1_i1.p1 TRINITY_DN28079_c0_g1~~TRINITY_DN28079_c0_g1_i1.p1  ORF type:complete len:857 (+),score=171.18 TRINITY_DN28079_c0_g1_i1:55-2625(+)
MAQEKSGPAVVGSMAPPPSPTTARRRQTQEAAGRAKYSHADVQRVYEKYGGSGSAIPGRLAAFLEPPSRRALGNRGALSGARHSSSAQSSSGQSRHNHYLSTNLQGQSPSAGSRSVPSGGAAAKEAERPKSGTGASIAPQLLAGLAGEVAGSVATPYGLGTVEGEADSQGRISVRFPWGRASLAAPAIDRSKGAVLRCQLQSLSSIFAVLVGGLPRSVARAPTAAGQDRRSHPLEAPSASSEDEDSDDGLDAEMAASLQGLGPVRALTSWLEEAALQPLPSQRDELLDVAVVLSSLVRVRTELLRLSGVSNTPQIEAELLAADAVRIHLGLLERLSAMPEAKSNAPSGLDETCKQWRQVLDQLGGTQGRLTAWRLVRPGAKLVDQCSKEDFRTSLPSRSTTTRLFRSIPLGSTFLDGIVPSQVTAGPVLRGPAKTVYTHITEQRSPSPLITRTVWPPVLLGPPQLRVSSSAAVLGSVVPGAPLIGAQGNVARFISTGSVFGPAPSQGSCAGAAVPRPATPLIARSASARWASPSPGVMRRASTPIPPKQLGMSPGVDAVTARAAASPLPSRGREYRSLANSSPMASTMPRAASPAVAPSATPSSTPPDTHAPTPQLGQPPSPFPLEKSRLIQSGPSALSSPDLSGGGGAQTPQALQLSPSAAQTGPGPSACGRPPEAAELAPSAFTDRLWMLGLSSPSAASPEVEEELRSSLEGDSREFRRGVGSRRTGKGSPVRSGTLRAGKPERAWDRSPLESRLKGSYSQKLLEAATEEHEEEEDQAQEMEMETDEGQDDFVEDVEDDDVPDDSLEAGAASGTRSRVLRAQGRGAAGRSGQSSGFMFDEGGGAKPRGRQSPWR